MTIASILEHLERYAPLSLAQKWDNVGLLIGEPQRQVNNVLISLDATANALDYAIDHDIDLILSHHPLIFRPISSITNPVILKMIESGISLISMHTNFDAALGGVNHALAEALGIHVVHSLGNPEDGDIGLICEYKEGSSLMDIAKNVKHRLNADALKLWTAGWNMDQQIQRVAICGGSGASVLPAAERLADLLITGDISYHSFLDSKIPIIDAGHFATEYPALSALYESLKSIGIPCRILDRSQHEWKQNMIYL